MMPGCGILRPTPEPTISSRPVAARIAILGAGIAGLAAARALRDMGFRDVVVLEARDRIGGRIFTSRIGSSVPVDLGASWIHGVEGNPITAIAAENGIDLSATDYDNASLHFHGGTETRPTGDGLVRGFWTLARRRPNAPLRAIYERYAASLVERDRHYLAYVLNTAVEHEFGADIADLSFRSVNGGEEFSGHDAVFAGGYRQIVDRLAEGLDVRLEHAVTQVDYTGAGVVLRTVAGTTLEAAAAIVTVPLGVLKAGSLVFRPDLPRRKRRAMDQLGMGVLNKTCLLFEDVFWEKDVELLGYVGAKTGQWAETLNLYPYTGQPILVMFNAGSYGARIEAMSDAEIVDEALTTLEAMYGRVPRSKSHQPGSAPAAERRAGALPLAVKSHQPASAAAAERRARASPLAVKDALITRWRSDPWSYGSYSYVPAGASFRLHLDLARPVDDKVFFAGEATHQDYPATVHGAFLSGVRAARQVAASADGAARLA